MVAALESSTSVLLSLALDATVMRQQALAQNIANVNTPGYAPVSVSFEENMANERALLASGGTLGMREVQGNTNLQARLLTSLDPNQTVALDEQVAQMAGNTLHHQVLLRALTKHFAVLGMAINEGKR